MLKTSSNEYFSACAEKILSVNADERLRVQAKLREKARLDHITSVTSVHEKGRAEGRAEERKEPVRTLHETGISEQDIQKFLST